MKRIIIPNKRNSIGFYYPPEILKKICDDINSKPIFGEILSCNDSDGLLRQKSQQVKKAWINREGDLVAEIYILETPAGSVVRKHLNDLTFRPRGLANADSDNNIVQYDIIAVDAKLKTDDFYNNPSPTIKNNSIVEKKDTKNKPMWERILNKFSDWLNYDHT